MELMEPYIPVNIDNMEDIYTNNILVKETYRETVEMML